jgi:hypothetical protein
MAKRAVFIGETNQAIMRGDEDLTLWDDEELIRGQRRDRNGRWSGRPPKVVPTAVHGELVRRRLSKAAELLRESVVDAALLLREVVTDEDADYGDRIKAANLIIERVMGKTPESLLVKVEHEPPWAVAIRAALVAGPPLGPNEQPVIDVESYALDNE